MEHELSTRELRRRQYEQARAIALIEAKPILRKMRKRYAAALQQLPTGGRMRLPEIIRFLGVAYRAIKRWRSKSMMSAVRGALLAERGELDRRSSDYLIVLRTALGHADLKQCSKWAAALDMADYERVRPRDLVRYLEEMGGIEGAAARRAAINKKLSHGVRFRPVARARKRALGLSNSPRPSDPFVRPWQPSTAEGR